MKHFIYHFTKLHLSVVTREYPEKSRVTDQKSKLLISTTLAHLLAVTLLADKAIMLVQGCIIRDVFLVIYPNLELHSTGG